MAKKKAKPEKEAAPRRTEPVYTVMTFVTFVAMVAGCVLLYLDYEEYGSKSPDKEAVPPLPKLGAEVRPAPAAPKAADPMADPMMP